jgi:hypothetical protein
MGAPVRGRTYLLPLPRLREAWFAAALLATPAQATTVADVLAAQAALQVPAGMDEAAWRAYRIANEPALQRAHAVLATAHAVEETVLATAQAAFSQYGAVLLCNYDEETRPGFPELVEQFVADGAARHGMPVAEARPRLLQADIEEMLPAVLLARYRCPPAASAGSTVPGSPPRLAAPR